jgi:hypothetical protein
MLLQVDIQITGVAAASTGMSVCKQLSQQELLLCYTASLLPLLLLLLLQASKSQA